GRERRDGLRRDRGRAARGASAGGQGRLHRQRGGGEERDARGGGDAQEGEPRAGRKVAEHLFRRRRFRGGGGRRAVRRVRQPGRGLLGGEPRARAEADLQEDARCDGGQ